MAVHFDQISQQIVIKVLFFHKILAEKKKN